MGRGPGRDVEALLRVDPPRLQADDAFVAALAARAASSRPARPTHTVRATVGVLLVAAAVALTTLSAAWAAHRLMTHPAAPATHERRVDPAPDLPLLVRVHRAPAAPRKDGPEERSVAVVRPHAVHPDGARPARTGGGPAAPAARRPGPTRDDDPTTSGRDEDGPAGDDAAERPEGPGATEPAEPAGPDEPGDRSGRDGGSRDSTDDGTDAGTSEGPEETTSSRSGPDDPSGHEPDGEVGGLVTTGD